MKGYEKSDRKFMEDFITFDTLCKIRQKGYKCNNARFEGHIYDVLKWLRESKGIHICISCSIAPFANWEYEIVEINGVVFVNADDGYNTYEEAAINGIEDVLNNILK